MQRRVWFLSLNPSVLFASSLHGTNVHRHGNQIEKLNTSHSFPIRLQYFLSFGLIASEVMTRSM